MENVKEEKDAPWLSVPQFGDWDQKGPLPDYSLDFSKIREKRKQNKRELSRTSIGNEEEFISSNKSKLDTPQPQPQPLAPNQDYNQPPNVSSSFIYSLQLEVTIFTHIKGNELVWVNNCCIMG
ncbi:hypothetical protein R6Q57_026161 [Mikania cordata]